MKTPKLILLLCLAGCSGQKENEAAEETSAAPPSTYVLDSLLTYDSEQALIERFGAQNVSRDTAWLPEETFSPVRWSPRDTPDGSAAGELNFGHGHRTPADEIDRAEIDPAEGDHGLGADHGSDHSRASTDLGPDLGIDSEYGTDSDLAGADDFSHDAATALDDAVTALDDASAGDHGDWHQGVRGNDTGADTEPDAGPEGGAGFGL